MKFGSVPLADAAGAILAHSITLPGGRLRKGVRLEASHLQQLSDAGHEKIVVARLDNDDVHENDAALSVARALSDRCTAQHLSEPFTGRVNLIADQPGVVKLDASRINAANMIDPSITVATVPAFHQIHPGGMVATVKIIAYGVARTAVEQACDVLHGAIAVQRPVYATASLIVSEITGGPGTKGVQAIRDRLEGLGMALEETLLCAHEEAAMTTAFKAAKGDMVLVLTGSATSDPADTAPSALQGAGGRLERFGMPVDPGNLLFLGALQNKPVIGLPGSARSPVLHGADWILSRVACGIKVSGDDMARMGVGGLLKEIPTRPQPRMQRKPG